MNAENLGNVVAKPQPSDNGSLIYYETDKGFGVHIDATSGKLLQVRHKDTGARVYVDGIEEYDDPDDSIEDIISGLKKAFYGHKRVYVRNKSGSKVSGIVVSIYEHSEAGFEVELLPDGSGSEVLIDPEDVLWVYVE